MEENMADYEKQTEKDLGKTYKNIGKLMSENMGAGITAGSAAAKQAMDDLNRDLLASQQYYLDEKARIEEETAVAEEAKYRRDYQNRLQKAKTASQAEIVRQNEQLRLQKKANKEYLEELKTHLEAVEAQVKVQKDRIVESFNEIAQKAAESLGEIENAREKMADKMSDYGGVFEKKKITFLNSGPYGSKEVFEDVVLDLSDEREELEHYADLLKKIQSQEDIPKALFDAIRGLSIKDAIFYQEALLALGKEEKAQYIADWEAIQKLATETASVSYAEDTKAVLQTVEQELEAWYGTVPSGFFEEGSLSAEAFGQGFLSKLSSMQNMLNEAMQSVLTAEKVVTPSAGKTMGEMIQNIQNSMTYVLNGAGETVSQQLRSVRAHATVELLREG